MSPNLRIVLFGAAAAGKSSLIGALVQAAQGPNAQLGGQLLDVSGGMTEVKNQTYQKGTAPTQDELRDYPLAVEPLAPAKGGPTTATLTDCSGPAAQALLAPEKGLPIDRPLAQALLDADALILVLDASASLDRNASHMGEFLRLLKSTRSQRADVGGLPIHLVLSKCDLIARPTDTNSQWLQRIEEVKRAIEDRFTKMLEDQAPLPFGGVKLHLSATAVKRPPLADRPAKSEPLGVAELFRETLATARVHHEHREHAAGRLSLTVAGMFGLVALMGLLSGTFYVLRPSAELTALENQVQRVLPGPGAADRLREPLEDRAKELEQLQEHPQYSQLPAALRADVEQARKEIALYQQYYKDFQAQVPDPRLKTRDEDLEKIEKSLNAFALPDAYTAAWGETRLMQRMQRYRQDIQWLRTAAKDEVDWLRQQAAEAQKLRDQVFAKGLAGDQRDAWFKQVQEHFDRAPRHKRREVVAPGSTLTYDHVYRLQRVEEARKAWDAAKKSLADLRKAAP